MTKTQTLLSGYRGSKVHAVDPTTARNRSMMEQAGEGVSLCGWAVTVGDVPFRANGLECKACAKAAR